MLVPLACLPLTIPLACGLVPGIVLLFLLSPMIALYSTNDALNSYEIGSHDYALIYISTALVALYFGILGFTVIYFRLETYFDLTPWAARSVTENQLCPFTNNRVNRRCPSCGCRVHKSAFKHSNNGLLLNFLGQQEALLWKRAKQCVKEADPVRGRQELDSYLEFTGNICSVSISSCCIGCHTWQLCFNIGRRLTLIYALASLFFAYFAWAFGMFLETIGTLGIVIKVASGVLANLLAASALVLELKSLSRASLFLIENPSLPRPKMFENQGKDSLLAKVLQIYSTT